MHIVHVAPHFPAVQKQFVRALKQVGAKVTGIGEPSADHLPHDVRQWLDHYEQVSSVTDENALLEAVRRIQGRGVVDRLEATIESHIIPTARVREACQIPGLTIEQAMLCRDKTVMKQFMRDHNIPTAASASADSSEEVIQFGRKHGYPIILKPRDGAGAAKTWKINHEDELPPALHDTGVAYGHSIAVEEFNEGHEGFYDTLTVNGEIRHEFISHYYPNVLEAMRHRWISPLIMVTNRINSPGYDEVKAMGRKVVHALGLNTAPTHMEWFFGPKGLRFSEIGARPPGVSHWDLYCATNEIDLYREWADSLIYGNVWGVLSRRYAGAMLALRPTQDGRITRYEGIDRIQQKYGEWIVNAYFPPLYSYTQPIEAGYMANAWMHLRYPDYDDLHAICMEIANTIKVIAE